MIYFAQAGENGPIKIGCTHDPRKRIASLQTGCPVRIRLLHSIPGARSDERAWHAQFAHLRTHGEWFEPHPDLIGAILALIPKRPARPPVVARPTVWVPRPGPETDWADCFDCRGTGDAEDEEGNTASCLTCGGEGFIWKSEWPDLYPEPGCLASPEVLRAHGYTA